MTGHVPYAAWIAIGVFATICTLAIWKGGPEERAAAAGYVLAALLTPLLKDHRWIGPQWAVFIVDVLSFSLLLVIALRTRRWWPLFAAGFQLLNVITHTASMVDTKLGAWAYITAGVIWSYATLAAILWGTVTAWRERQAGVAPERDATRR